MKLRTTLLVLLALATIGTSIVRMPSTAHATTFDQSNIIDDSIFDNSQTMTTNDIQNFLNSFPNSCLSNYSSPYPTSYSVYGANVSAATVIRRAADLWGINPQVILSTLEKEESLVTGGAGCAGWQYNSAMGMGCPDTGPCPSPSYAGFSQQVTKGAWQLMFNRERAEGNTTWDGDGDITYVGFMTSGNYARIDGGSKTYYDGYATIDGSSVYISNGATASLYTYTPHFSGNQSFSSIFSSWFGQTHGTILIQAPSSPTVFLQDGTTAYAIPSSDILAAYGLNNIVVTPVTNQYMQSLTSGGVLGTTFMEKGYGAVYLADNGYRFGFSTNAQCVNWGFPNCLSSVSLSPYIFNLIHNGGDMKSLMLNGNAVYLMQNGQKRVFLSGQAMTENGYTSSDVVPITNQANLTQPAGYSIPQNNSFVTFGSNPTIYFYSSGNFYPVQSYSVLLSLLPPNSNVSVDNYSLYNSQPPTSQQAIGSFITTGGGSKEYILSNGSVYDISSVASDWPAAQASDEVGNLIIAKSSIVTVGSNSTFQTPSGYLFRVSNKTVLPFYSLSDYFSSSYAKQPIQISSDIIAGLPTGNPVITPGGGSLFKLSGAGLQNNIYTLDAAGTTCGLNSASQLGDFNFNTTNVQTITQFMSTGNMLHSLIKTTGGLYYLVSGGKKTPVTPTQLASWGVNQATLCTFTDAFLSTFPNSSTNSAALFTRTPDGTIYYVNQESVHKITSYAKFLSLGGSNVNTISVPQDFSSYVTIGQNVS